MSKELKELTHLLASDPDFRAQTTLKWAESVEKRLAELEARAIPMGDVFGGGLPPVERYARPKPVDPQ